VDFTGFALKFYFYHKFNLMVDIRHAADVSTVVTVEELLDRLPSMAGSDIAVHFRLRNGVRRVVFVSVTPAGKALQSYGMSSELSSSDYAV
jgi:hypothetical protein